MTLSTEKEIQQSYSEQCVADEYVNQRFTSELMRLLHEHQVGVVSRIMREHQPKCTLEIAPGPGRIMRDIDPSGVLTCLEFNEEMIQVGRVATNNGAIWIQGNAFELPFSEQFDLVYTFRFIRHFRREDRDRLYAQIRSVLHPGGLLVMDAVNRQVSAPLRQAYPDAYPIYDKLFDNESEIRNELEQAGFRVLKLKPVQRWYPLQYQMQVILGPRSRTLCRWAIRTLEQLRRGPALEWIVTCRRV